MKPRISAGAGLGDGSTPWGTVPTRGDGKRAYESKEDARHPSELRSSEVHGFKRLTSAMTEKQL